MTDSLYWLTLTALLAAVLWVPYILERIGRIGLMGALGYNKQTGTAAFNQPDETPAAWSNRANRAHLNMLESLPIFAALVLAAEVAGVGPAVATWAMVFFFARLVHFVVYVAAVPGLRTLSFAVSWLALLAIGLALLTAA